MGRTEASRGLAPQSLRKDRRAKEAKHLVNKVIPSIVASDPRAREGINAAELIVDPPLWNAGLLGRTDTSDEQASRRESNGKIRGSKSKRKSSREEDFSELRSEAPSRASPRSKETLPTVRLVNCTLLRAAALFKKHGSTSKSKTTALLNPASPLRPGGGFLNGARSGEETLCTFTTLYPSLKEEFYRLPEIGGIWTKDVIVFREPAGTKHVRLKQDHNSLSDTRDSVESSKTLGKSERWRIDVLSAGMLRFPEVDTVVREEDHQQIKDAQYVRDQDRQLVIKKITSAMRIFASKGSERIVVPAWGCGSYGNPVGEVARAWRHALFGDVEGQDGKHRLESLQKRWPNVKEIVFAINESKLAEEFSKAFAVDLEIEILEDDLEDPERESDQDQESLSELERRIAETENALQRVRNPDLRDRLQIVLADLKRQLAAASTNSSTVLDASDDGSELDGR